MGELTTLQWSLKRRGLEGRELTIIEELHTLRCLVEQWRCHVKENLMLLRAGCRCEGLVNIQQVLDSMEGCKPRFCCVGPNPQILLHEQVGGNNLSHEGKSMFNCLQQKS